MVQRSIIGMAGTSPAMTKWEMPRVLPLLRDAAIGIQAQRFSFTRYFFFTRIPAHHSQG
jgi:hypothetical protein